jgi:hypothetical protein
MKIINFLLLNFFVFSFFRCDTTEPPEDNLQPGRRDYDWTVDTLIAPAGNIFYLWSIWGSDTGNIWIAGQGDLPYNLWHYDGERWEAFTNNVGSLISIYGFDENNIWSVGGDCISHFVGSSWNIFKCFDLPNNPPNSSDIGLSHIWGNSFDNIFAVGGGYSSPTGIADIGVILHFNGNEWEQIQLQQQSSVFTNIKKNFNNGKYYLSATKLGETVPDTNKIYEFDGSNLREIWSGNEIATANGIDGDVYLAIGKLIYKYQNNNLVIWKDFSGTTYLGRIWGRNEKDFFGVASDGLAHYNGSDLKTIYPTNLFINDVFVMEKVIYMLCENRIIIHGKLKN